MTPLHQNWQATDDADDRRVRITATTSSKQNPVSKTRSQVSALRSPAVPAATRRPAAIVGVILCIIAGVAAFQGFNLSGSRGQVDTNSVTVHLRSSGADPVTISVEPGMTITWTNDDTIPHVLASDTLPTADGKPFVTSAIFPGSSTHILIPLTAADGAYPYISKTAEIVSGQILIHAAATTTTSTPVVTSAASVSSASSEAVFVPPAPASLDQSAESSAPQIPDDNGQDSLPAAVVPGLPVNSHTVGSGEVPLPDRQTPGGNPAITQHTPRAETESGPEVWIVVAIATGAVLLFTRKAFRTV